MTRTELLQQLQCRYSIGKSMSIVNMATDDGIFENDDVLIIVTEGDDANLYGGKSYWCDMEWK